MASAIFLLPEIISPTLTYLRNDPYSLHSCMLVSRVWCKLAIPLLWTNPFNPYSSNVQIVTIYLKFLDPLKKSFLKKLYPEVLKEDEGGELDIDKPALFNYPAHLKVLRYSLLHEAVRAWCSRYRITDFYKEGSHYDDLEDYKEYIYDGGEFLLFNARASILEFL